MGSKRAVVSLMMVLLLASAAAGEERFHVMVANDDGIDAPGIAALVEVLAADDGYRITVVAPAEQQSVTGHAHVTRREVAARPHTPLAGSPAWSVDATPASVVRVGLTAILADDPPELVVSGINRGENDGLGAWTSGTVAAAREAALIGVPAVALSLQLDWDDPRPDFAAAARWAKPVVDALRSDGLPPGVYLNVNIPRDTDAVRGYRLARMGIAPPEIARFELMREEDGARWYRSRWRPPTEGQPGTDIRALQMGWVSIVPLGLDQTDYRALSVVEELQLTVPEASTTTEPSEDRAKAEADRVAESP
jgi:5'-nucleotidase